MDELQSRATPVAERNAEKSTKRKGQRLSPAEHIAIAQLARNNLSVADIARAVGRHQHTIAANLKASRQLLEAYAPEFVQDWKTASSLAAIRGDHRPAMDALERARVVHAPRPDPQVPPVQINVGIGLPGIPSQPTSPTSRHAELPAIQGEVLVRSSDLATPSPSLSQPDSESLKK